MQRDILAELSSRPIGVGHADIAGDHHCSHKTVIRYLVQIGSSSAHAQKEPLHLPLGGDFT